MPVWGAGMRAGSNGRPRSCRSRLGRGTIPPFIEPFQSRDEPRLRAHLTDPLQRPAWSDKLSGCRYGHERFWRNVYKQLDGYSFEECREELFERELVAIAAW